jgi:hypothetical protein
MSLLKILLKLFGAGKDDLDYYNEKREARQASPSQYRFPRTVERTPAEWESYFRDILLRNFSSYTIRENVPVTDLVGFANDEAQLYTTRPTQAYKAEWGQPYSFVLEADGKAKAVVMLGSGHSHDSNVKYLIARMYAEKLDLPYINFYTQMPNERNYVIERIRKFLN